MASTRGFCFSARMMACSRPPPPMTMSFMGIPPIVFCYAPVSRSAPVGADYISARTGFVRRKTCGNRNCPRAHIQCAPTAKPGAWLARAAIQAAPTANPGRGCLFLQLSSRHELGGLGEQNPLGLLHDAALQDLRRVAGEDIHGLLQDDFAAVGDFVYIMYRGAGDLDAVPQRRLVDLEAVKTLRRRRMGSGRVDVQNPIGPLSREIRRQIFKNPAE